MTAVPIGPGLQKIIDGPPPPCVSEPCQDLAHWCAVAPSVNLFSCSRHLGELLEQVGSSHLVWFVLPFKDT